MVATKKVLFKGKEYAYIDSEADYPPPGLMLWADYVAWTVAVETGSLDTGLFERVILNGATTDVDGNIIMHGEIVGHLTELKEVGAN